MAEAITKKGIKLLNKISYVEMRDSLKSGDLHVYRQTQTKNTKVEKTINNLVYKKQYLHKGDGYVLEK